MCLSSWEELGSIIEEMGTLGAEIVGGEADGLFIYMEVSEYSAYGAVFKDEGAQVRYFGATLELFDLAAEAWEATPEGRRWFVLEYDVHGQSFDAKLIYPEEVDLAMDASDRRRAALDRRYGDKPVIYPPIPDSFRLLE